MHIPMSTILFKRKLEFISGAHECWDGQHQANLCCSAIVMWLLLESRGESRGAVARATVPWRYSTMLLFMCERGRGPAARAVRGAGNAGRRASPTAGKREGFSF
jgi:hypothetical protein